jgi:hypothetical protein
MSRFVLKVNGQVEFDGALGQWMQKPPDFVKDKLKPGTKPEAWVKAVMIVLTESLMLDESVAVEVNHQPRKWSMEVNEL